MNVSDRGRAVIRLDDGWKADACSRVAPNSSQFNGCRPCTTSRLTAQFDRSLRLLSSLSQDFLADFAREQRPSVSIGLRYLDRISRLRRPARLNCCGWRGIFKARVGRDAIVAFAQQVTGVLGSPSATTTIPGNQLPPPPPEFGGVIKESAKDSKPWWAPRVVPPAGAPNVLLIMTDDQGYGGIFFASLA